MAKVEIVGTGSYLPADPISNEKLATVFGREVIWLAEMLGAHKRHFAMDLDRLELRQDETNASMATKAAQQAILDADIDPGSIDLIIMSTSTPDYPFPATALFVQEQLGLPNCCVMELRAGCGGMAQAFVIATNLIMVGTFKTALLIGSELISPYMTLFGNNRSEIDKDYLVSLAMFGDGAGAVILSASSTEGVLDCMSRSMSPGNPPGMILRKGGALWPADHFLMSDPESGKIFHHDFKAIMRNGPVLMQSVSDWFCNEKGYLVSDVDFVIPPQANARLIDQIHAQMQIAVPKVFSNFARVANTVSASIYIALDQMNKEGVLKPNDLLMLLPAEGTKWLYGAIIVRWTKGRKQ